MRFKKIVGLSLAVAASALMLSACGSSSSSKSSKGAESKTLTFWYGGDANADVKPLAQKFQKKTGIKVKVQAIPWSQYNNKLLTAAASKSGPDVMVAGTTEVANYASSKTFMDITKDVKGNKALHPSNFFNGSVDTTRVNGKYYAVPWYVETRVLFYRKDLLKKVGYNHAPKTWAELYDAAGKLSKIGKYGFYVDPDDNSFGFMFARQNGAKLMNGKKPNFNSKQTVQAISYLNKFVQKKYSPAQNPKLSIGQTFGGSGKIEPMFISGPWMVKMIQQDAGLKDSQWGVATLPKGKDNNMSLTGGGDLAVFNYTKNKKNAIKFLKFMSERSSQLTYYKTSNSMPTMKSAWTAKPLQEKKIQVFRTQLNNAEPMPLIKQWDQIGTEYTKTWDQIAINKADVKKSMDTFNGTVTQLMNK